MKKSTLRRVDLVFSIILIITSIIIMYNGYKLFINPFGRSLEKITTESIQKEIENWYISPALMPFLLAIVLCICGLFLLRVALKDGAKFDFFKVDKLKFVLMHRETRVATIVITILALYIFVLIPVCRENLDFYPTFRGFPFMIATFICLLLQMFIFSEKTLKNILSCIIVASLSSVVITYGFGVLAMIPLP
ncbi:hypothetical protein AN641_05485 [Candidatus Epulonipiscioides gigas]|nr:hypothetical protein AN641_05485 [Epulopiscium sp. SCG-C07WGA-EpuloA2]